MAGSPAVPAVAAASRPTLGRRRFLLGAGSTSLVVASGFHDWLFREVIATALSTDADGVLTTRLYRPADQLWLRYEFVGLRLSEDGGWLERDGSGIPPFVRVIHPPQHLSEAGIALGASPSVTPVDHRVAGPSRVVFDVAAPLPFHSETLLALSLPRSGSGSAGDPGPDVTFVEIPADLVLTSSPARVQADRSPVAHGDVTQLHRTVIESRADARPLQVQAVLNRAQVDGFAGRLPSATQRNSIVAASTAEAPATARRLWLTPHGANARIDGSWQNLDWSQETAWGRDELVHLATRCTILPFGHRATWVDTSARRWVTDASGVTTAVMVTEQYLTIDDSTVVLDPATQPFEGRAMPFATVTAEAQGPIATVRETITGIAQGDAWIPRRAGSLPANVFVAYTATDVAGNPPVTFNLPAVIVTDEAAAVPSVRNALDAFYASASSAIYRNVSLSSDLAWAPEQVAGSGRTRLWTSSLELQIDPAPPGAPSLLAPVVTGGKVRLPDIEPPGVHPSQLTLDVSFPDVWLDGGFGGDNPDLTYLEVETPRLFPLGNEARAVMTPDILAGSLNQTLGIGPELDDLVGGLPDTSEWSPEKAFGEAAEILRGIALAAIVNTVTDLTSARLGIDIPELKVIALPDELRTEYRWCPDELNEIPIAGFYPSDDSRLCISLEAVVALSPQVQAGATVEFSVTDFTLMVPPLLGIVELDVAELRGVQPSGGPTDLTFDITAWRLGGILDWLEPVVKFLSPGGKAFDLDIDLDAIDTSLTLPAPELDFGVLKVTGLAIDLAGRFPFRGVEEPVVGFGIGKPQNPVTVKVLQFEGGFFARFDFTTQGLEKVRIQARAAADLVTIDIKVAKAYCRVEIMAEFRLDSGKVTFIGELALEASFNVLGLVGATLRIVGRVEYKEISKTVTISGRIEWSVTALFTFSGTVPLGSIEFALGGQSSGSGGGTSSALGLSARSGNAPAVGVGAGGTTFGDLHTADTWADYVRKFAAA